MIYKARRTGAIDWTVETAPDLVSDQRAPETVHVEIYSSDQCVLSPVPEEVLLCHEVQEAIHAAEINGDCGMPAEQTTTANQNVSHCEPNASQSKATHCRQLLQSLLKLTYQCTNEAQFDRLDQWLQSAHTEFQAGIQHSALNEKLSHREQTNGVKPKIAKVAQKRKLPVSNEIISNFVKDLKLECDEDVDHVEIIF